MTMNPHYAIHYFPPRPPVLFRFRSRRERDAYVAERPHYRRAVPPPATLAGFTDDRICLENDTLMNVAFRTATLDDITPPQSELANTP